MDYFIIETAPSPSGEEVVCKMEAREGRSIRQKKARSPPTFRRTQHSERAWVRVESDGGKIRAHRIRDEKDGRRKSGAEAPFVCAEYERALREKLIVRGVSRDVAADAVEFIADCGYINEYEMALSLVSDMAKRRGYGRLRIKNELFSKGFERETASRALEESDIDYVDICAERIRKLGGTAAFAERDARMKNVSALARCGFTTDEIKEALTRVKEEE
jgi:SOS response regulatory protein OraA/RecX